MISAPRVIGILTQDNITIYELPAQLLHREFKPGQATFLALLTLASPRLNMTSKIIVEPLRFPEDSGINFGAVVSNVDIEDLTGKTMT